VNKDIKNPSPSIEAIYLKNNLPNFIPIRFETTEP